MSESLAYTNDKDRLIQWARQGGMSDEDILGIVLQNEPAGNHRRQMVVDWGKALGLDASSALRKAQRAGLIPSVHRPRAVLAVGKPLDKGQEK